MSINSPDKLNFVGLSEESKLSEIRHSIVKICMVLGIELTASNEDTPRRIANMYVNELFKNVSLSKEAEQAFYESLTTFPAENKVKLPGEDAAQVSIAVPFSSMCEHHWLPFYGDCYISYEPNNSILGLSKFYRIVDFFSKRPQLQERLTRDIGVCLVQVCDPISVNVNLTAEHTCMACRGVEKECNTDTTFSYRKP